MLAEHAGTRSGEVAHDNSDAFGAKREPSQSTGSSFEDLSTLEPRTAVLRAALLNGSTSGDTLLT